MVAVVAFDIGEVDFTTRIAGASWSRGFIVRDLVAPITDMESLLAEVAAALPAAGSYADPPLNSLQLWNKRVSSVVDDVGGARARGTLEYRTPTRSSQIPSQTGPATVRTASASAVQITTDLDDTGAQMTTTFDGKVLAHEAESFVTVSEFTLSRPEDADPETKGNAYASHTNLNPWRGYAARTVLCVSISGAEDEPDSGIWTVDYRFQFRPSWAFEAVHEDPFFPGRPLPGATGAARASYNQIPAIDFAGLNIP